jgi:hypothetical protein
MTGAAACVNRGILAISPYTEMQQDITGLLSIRYPLRESLALVDITGRHYYYAENKNGWPEHSVLIRCSVQPPRKFFAVSSAQITENA